jgi:hypothetical protein
MGDTLDRRLAHQVATKRLLPMSVREDRNKLGPGQCILEEVSAASWRNGFITVPRETDDISSFVLMGERG